MSMGGNFHAVTDGQLARLLGGELPPDAFLHAGGEERPQESFSRFEHLWYELQQVLAEENACGADVTDAIAELCGYSSAQEAASTAVALALLDDAAIRQRCADAAIDEEACDALCQAVPALAAFYQRAAERGDAVLFRVT